MPTASCPGCGAPWAEVKRRHGRPAVWSKPHPDKHNTALVRCPSCCKTFEVVGMRVSWFGFKRSAA